MCVYGLIYMGDMGDWGILIRMNKNDLEYYSNRFLNRQYSRKSTFCFTSILNFIDSTCMKMYNLAK